MTPRQKQIAEAMTGRQAAMVSDTSLRDAVRDKLVTLATEHGRPLQVQVVGGLVSAVLSAAAKTIIFEGEVPIALEMGAAGELEHEGTGFTQSNCSRWLAAYACSGDRRAAQEWISIQAARDRKRADAVSAAALRESFERDGLRRAWDTFMDSGVFDFRTGFAAVLYDRVGTATVKALLTKDQIMAAHEDAFASVRREHPQKYRTAPDAEVEATDIFVMHFKAHLCRAYFETLRDRELSIEWIPGGNTSNQIEAH